MQYEEGWMDCLAIMSRQRKSHDVFYITEIPNFFAMPQDNYIKLYWLYPNDGSITHVQIRRKLGGYPQDLSDGTLVYAGDGIEYNDLNVTYSTTYYYRIFYYDKDGVLVDSFTTCNATTNAYIRYKLYFDGVNNYTTIPYNSTLYSVFATGNYSIIVKFNEYTLSETDGHTNLYSYPQIMALWKDSGQYGYNAFNLNCVGFSTKYLSNPTQTITHNSVSANQDTQLSIIGDNSQNANNVKIYKNSSPVGNQNGMKSDIVPDSVPFVIGAFYAYSVPGYIHHFKGVFTEVQIWNRTLNEAENLFYSQYSPQGNESGLLLYYDFSEGSGNTLHNKGSLGSVCNGVINSETWQNL